MTDQIVTLGRQIEAALRRGDTETATRCAEEQRDIVEAMVAGNAWGRSP